MTDDERRNKLTTPKVERRWTTLRILASLLQLAAVVTLFGGVAAAALNNRYGVDWFYGISGVVGFLMLGALGQLCEVQIAREENERITHKYLAALLKRQS